MRKCPWCSNPNAPTNAVCVWCDVQLALPAQPASRKLYPVPTRECPECGGANDSGNAVCVWCEAELDAGFDTRFSWGVSDVGLRQRILPRPAACRPVPRSYPHSHTCPWCGIGIEIVETNCKIFICGATKDGQVHQHREADAARLRAEGKLVIGCGNQFELIGDELSGALVRCSQK